MKLLVVLPNWLGDAIMTTPAIEALSALYPKASITLVGSYVSTEAIKYHPQIAHTFIDSTKEAKSRIIATKKFANKIGEHDIAVTFRDNIFSSMLLYFTRSKIRIGRLNWLHKILLTHPLKLNRADHLVEQYHKLIAQISKNELSVGELKLHIKPIIYKRPTLGINPGATYGSAKRWYPEKFADIAKEFANKYDIVIFGGPNETKIASDIEKILIENGVDNVTNLAGKTSIKELCEHIGSLSLFVTNDSGPMHVAAAYKVPTVAIFGPTKDKETSQWRNPKGVIVKKEIECAPCMKRTCPLKHHECMRRVEGSDVIRAIHALSIA